MSYGTVTGANDRCWLDRNLGAAQVATGSTDTEIFGDLFQWGRLADGHQERYSTTTTTLSSTDVPGHGNFILTPDSPYDWRSPQNNSLWQGVFGINNPYPEGFRTPTYAEWVTESASWSPNNAEGAISSSLKLPMSGYRFQPVGEPANESSNGYYWSSTIDNTKSWFISINNGGIYMIKFDRGHGMSVRCIKD